MSRDDSLQIKDTLIIMINNKCEYECNSCLFDCSAKSDSKIDREKLIGILSKITGDIKKIHFSGGEPFEDYKLLIECVKIARKKNKILSCRTSCFWANDYKDTEAKLLELKKAGLTHLVIDLNGISSRVDKVENYKRVIDISGNIRIKNSFNITNTKEKMLGDDLNLLGRRVLNKTININKDTKNMSIDELKKMNDDRKIKHAIVLDNQCDFNWYVKGHFYGKVDEKDISEITKYKASEGR